MDFTLTWALALFALGYVLHRSSSVRVAAVVCLVLGGLLVASPEFRFVVHTLGDAFNALT